MKKILVLLICLAVASSFVLAKAGPNDQEGINEGDKGNDNKGNPDDAKPMLLKNEEKEQENNQEQEIGKDNESDDSPNQNKNQEKNQNQVREAVHALLAMENRTGGIGPQVSEIARNFSNNINKTEQLEQKIQNRNWFKRFFAGGDDKSAEEIESEVTQNQERIRELKELRLKCNCTKEVEQEFDGQLQLMEQEQTRLQELASKEKQSKGLFGWIWKP